MVFEKPKLHQQRGLVTPEDKGRREARKDKYFNPYSVVSQGKQYREFEYGWNDEMKKIDPDKVTTRTRYPVAVFVLVIAIIIGIIYYFA